MKKIIALLLPILALAPTLPGCSSNTTTLTPISNSATADASSTPAAQNELVPNAPGSEKTAPDSDTGSANTGAPGQPHIPKGMSVGSGGLTPTPDLDKKIAALSKGKDKIKLADSYAARGTYRMNDEPASPRVKYRAALADYRQALKLDPNNAEAKTNKDLIESIYRSMGKPIPQ